MNNTPPMDPEEDEEETEIVASMSPGEMLALLDKYATVGEVITTPFDATPGDAGVAILVETCRAMLATIRTAQAWIATHAGEDTDDERFDPDEEV